MSSIAARKLHTLIVDANSAFLASGTVKGLDEAYLINDLGDLITRISDLVRDTSDEIMRADLTVPDRVQTLISRLKDSEKAVMNAICKKGSTAGTARLVPDIVVERFEGIAEQLENAGIRQTTVTRKEMINETESLIAEVKDWKLEEYAKRTLLLQLDHISRIIHAADTYSESELRMRVKSIIADFATEFSEMDKAHQTHLERLIRWGRCGFFAGTIFLGLTSDVVGITAALPSPPLMIGSN